MNEEDNNKPDEKYDINRISNTSNTTCYTGNYVASLDNSGNIAMYCEQKQNDQTTELQKPLNMEHTLFMLYDALYKNNSYEFDLLLAQIDDVKVLISYCDSSGASILARAITFSNVSAIESIIKHYPNLEKTTLDNDSVEYVGLKDAIYATGISDITIKTLLGHFYDELSIVDLN
jgi:hypothetical protein